MAAKKKAAKKTAKKVTKKRATKAARKATRKTAKKGTARKAARKKVTAKKARAKKTARKVAARKTVKKAAKAAARKKPTKKARKTAKKAAAKTKTAKKKAAKKKTAKKTTAKKTAKKPAAAKKAAPKTKEDGAPVSAKAPAPPKPVKLTAFVKKQRQRLLDLRDELMDVMYGVQQETLRNAPSGSEASGSGMHQGDAGSDAYDRDFALNLLSKEQDALHEIEAALERIQRGAYGICEISGKKIPQARLEAIPFARLTVECQSQWEQEHPNRQFRSADALGFLGGGTNGTPAVSLDAGTD